MIHLLKRLVSIEPYERDNEWGYTSCMFCGCAHPPRYGDEPREFGHWANCDWLAGRRLAGLPVDGHIVWDSVAHCKKCSDGATIIDHMAHKAAELEMWRLEWAEEKAEYPERFDLLGMRRFNLAAIFPKIPVPRGSIQFPRSAHPKVGRPSNRSSNN